MESEEVMEFAELAKSSKKGLKRRISTEARNR
jgi:hypothetical protein